MDPQVRAALEVLGEAPPEAFAVPSGAGTQTAVLAQRALERVTALRVDAVAAVEAEDSWRAGGAASVQAWAREALGLAGGEAGSLVRTARVLREQLPKTRAAWWSGVLGANQVALLVRHGVATPARAAAVAQPGGEDTLVQVAASVSPADLGRVLAAWAHGVDAAGVEAIEAEAYESRRLSLAQTFGGVWALEGVLDPVGGATVAAALDALVGAAVTRDGETRSATQVRADALVELARAALDSGNVPRTGGLRPHLLLHVEPDTLTGRRGGPGAELAPGRAPISGLLAQLLGCDSEVTAVGRAGPNGDMVVGRTRRTVPTRLRLAVVARDRGCVFPGCDRPASWCDVHHLRWWSRGGLTELANLGLFCRHHHRVVHAHDLRTEVPADGSRWVFRYPDGRPWAGGRRRGGPRRRVAA